MEITTEIIEKYLLNNCSEEECEELLKWVETSEDNKRLFSEMKNTFTLIDIANSGKNDINLSENYNVVLNKINKSSRFILSSGWRIAASIVVTFGLTAFFSYLIWHKPTQVVTHELSVPSGQQAQLTLGDGTKIWLNSKSKLTYPGTFEGDLREVTLEGEGYFQVSHNAQKPFIVKTSDINIKVLGTSFNVTNYSDEDNITLSLETGSVSLTKKGNDKEVAKLKPSDQIVYSRKSSNIEFYHGDAEIYKSWLKGQFKFRNLSFLEISRRLSRNFNVNFVFKSNEMKYIKYSGSFYNYEPLDQILKIMQTNSSFKYKIDKDKVFIN
jgi:ferric-dicitrate binding protein FerR (iron transport regulator)